ncbi:RNA pseudouridine synthase [Candidatus Haliotispira prima]|uniref:RNA pseudouridine synthase n=1 Tax=Candidatus Haliotispira prima TaxID=3034016 RepID=A0ABY8MIG2_9SPIO|nr:RNA pseudouridine synthase [Candidatus Haliotispira prima]
MDSIQQTADAAFFASFILYEDAQLLLVCKPNGTPVQRDRSGDRALPDYAKAYLIERYRKPGNAYIGLPHRLDRPVSGLCVMAKTGKAMQRLSGAFQQHQVRKFYLAAVEGRLDTGSEWQELSHYLRKEAVNNKSYVCRATTPNAKPAKLRYRSIVAERQYSIVAVELETGRHHQIRCQLAKLGHPILGDLKYGAKHSNANADINLHAFALELPMPIQQNEAEKSSPGRQNAWLRQREFPSPLSWLPATYAWQSSQPARPEPARLQPARLQPARPHKILRCVCLPWEWLRQNGANSQSVWEPCSEQPGLLGELEHILDSPFPRNPLSGDSLPII